MYRLLFFTGVTLFCLVESRKIECPKICSCDLLDGLLKRATCQKRNLIGIEAGFPKETDILDVAYNHISDLKENIFIELELINLKRLNLSKNKLRDIHVNAFEGLTKLKELDLSYNYIEYLTQNWVVSLVSLQDFFLTGNNLMRFNEFPLQSTSLRVLYLSESRIESLKDDIFAGLPNLTFLDLSGNYLKELGVEVLRPLTKLKKLIIHNNNFACGRVMEALRNYTESRHIIYIDPCLKSKEGKKFEKIIDTRPPEDTFWLDYDSGELTEEIKELKKATNISCRLPEAEPESFLMEVLKLSPTLAILFTLVFGIMLGLILGCSLQVGGGGVVEVQRDEETDEQELVQLRQLYRRPSTLNSKKRITEDTIRLMPFEFETSLSTPALQRKFEQV